MKIIIQSDGSMTSAAAIAFNEDGRLLAERARLVEGATVPVCEYVGLILGLQLAYELGASEVECWMDAELVQRQVTREYACRDGRLAVYLSQVRDAMGCFAVAEVKLFPKAGPKMKRRYLNGKADKLAAEAARAGCSINRIHTEIAR